MLEADVEWWSQSIADTYLPKLGPDQAATLSVDRTTLGEMVGSDDDSAVQALTAVVREQLGRRASFARVLSETRYWAQTTDRASPPPCLPLLAVVVLAASEMGAHSGFAANNYYGVLREILGIGEAGAPPSFMNSIEELWATLDEWLDVDLGGARGTSTFKPPDGHFRYIGYGIAQSLVRGADRRLIRRFLADMGERESGVAIEQVLRHLQIWLRRHGSAAERLLDLLDDPYYRELCESIVSAEMERAVGESARGRRRGRIELAIEPQPFSTYLIARRGGGWNDALSLWAPGRSDMVLSALDDDWYDPGPLTAFRVEQVLEDGLVLASEGLELEIDPLEIWALRYEDDLGAWVSTGRLRFEEDHLLLVAAELADEVCSFAESEGTVRSGVRAAGGLRGWKLVGPVRFEAPPTSQAPPDLARLLGTTAVGPGLRLQGGLRVGSSPRIFLTGGEPIVTLQDDHVGLPVVIRGSDLSRRLDPVGLQVRLSNLDLPEGRYSVDVGAESIELDLVDDYRTDLPEQRGEVQTEARGNCFTGYVPVEPMLPAPAPAVIRHEPEHTYALGAKPYEVLKLRPPFWLEELTDPLSWRVVEVEAPFDVVWSVLVKGGLTTASLVTELDPKPDKDHAKLWARLLLDAQSEGDAGALLGKYQTLARSIAGRA